MSQTPRPHILREEQRMLRLLEQAGPLQATEMRALLGISEGRRAYLVLRLERQGQVHRRKDDQHRVTVHIGPGRGRTDLLSQQDDEDRHRDYAIKSTQIAPGHTRIQFGSHYRVGRGQHHPSAGQGGASSLVTVYE
jgi:hypothetical protein